MPDFTPTVSVIIPVYNGAATIRECLDSLLKQNYPPFEIIVVENGSSDETTTIVESYPVRLVHSSERGPAAARNMGIAHSTSEIVAFTDADCIAHPNWVLELVKPYADDNVGGVGGAILAYEHPDRNFVEIFSHDHSPLVNFISGEHEFRPHLYTANASYRREIITQVGGFNPHLLTGEDVDLAWRIQLQTDLKLQYAPQAIINHYHRSTRTRLGRQYRQYGFGEIVLDTLYGKYQGYPRTRRFQVRRMMQQIAALPRYLLSIAVRRVRLLANRTTPYEAVVPELWLLIESNNLLGKIEALAATRFMTSVQEVMKHDAVDYIHRFY